MINYLFSGIDKEKGFNKKQTEYLKKDIKNGGNIVFIASIFNMIPKSQSNYEKLTSCFEKIGIIFNKTYLIDSRVSKEKSKEYFRDADYVFLMGGSPYLQMKSILEYKIAEDIKKVKVVIGVSAGSMNQSKRVMYKDDYENYELKDYKGLGLVDINIFPHIDFENKSLIEEANEIKKEIPLILLPNDSFVRVEDGRVEVIGEFYQ